MSMLTALTSHLQNHAGLAGVISSRVYPARMFDPSTSAANTFPLVTYQLIDEAVSGTHGNNHVFAARVQVDAWGDSYKAAHAAATQVFAALEGYSGAMGDQSVDVGGCFRKAKRDLPEPDVNLHRVSQDFRINWKEL